MGQRAAAGPSASGSIIVALIRVITSAPKGCCGLSIDATATGVPVARSSRVATTVVVPRSKAMPNRRSVVSPGSTSIEHVVDDHRGDLVVGLRAARAAEPAQRGRSTRSSRSSSASSSRSRSVRWSARRRLGQLHVALLHRGPQDHLPADADGGRLGPGGQRRHLDPQVLRRPGRGRPAASPRASSSGLKARGSSRDTATSPSTTCTLHLRQVPWPPQVESIAMPFQLAASNSVTPAGTRTSRGLGPRRGRSGRGPGPATSAVVTWAVTVRPTAPRRPSAACGGGPGARRSRPCPTRRGRAAGRRP